MSSHPDNSHHALAGCGERLKQAREAAGLSIDDVAAKLHMPSRIVRSLEAEDWSRLGAPVFVRGQVRSYSRLMGLMTAPMLDALEGVGPVEPSRIVSRTHTPKAQWWAEQLGRRLVYIVLTLFLVVPAWVATRQHLSNTGDAAPLDLPVDTVGQAPAKPATPRPPCSALFTPAPLPVAACPAAGDAPRSPPAPGLLAFAEVAAPWPACEDGVGAPPGGIGISRTSPRNSGTRSCALLVACAGALRA